MKKIKYLLLGIVSLLGIGCSFGAVPFYFDYFTNNGGLTSYNLSNNHSFAPCIYKYYSKSYVADLQYYQQSCNSSFNSNFLGFSVYYDSNGNKLTYRLNAGSNDRPGYLFVLSSNLAGENITNVGNGAYSRILAGIDCLGSDIFQSGSFCTPNFIQLFTNKYYTISSLGNIYDSDYNGVHYYKGPVSPAVGLGYSFGFVTGSGRQNSGNHYYLNTGNGDFFTFRSVSFSGSNMSSFEGVLLMRLNSTSSVSDSSDYKLFALGLTGSINNYSFIYSIYNCPSTAGKYDDCVFSEGGNISENFSYDFESSNPYSNLIYLLTKPGAVKLNNSYSSSNNTITLTSQLNSNTSYLSNTTYSITLNLVPTDGIDIIGSAPSVDNGNQSTGSMAINTGLINLCLTSPSFYDLNTVFCNRVFGGRDLSYIQGQIGSGAYLQSYIDGSGNLVYVIDIVDEPGTLTGSVVWECYGDRCINSVSGSWGDVEPWEILHLSGGDILSSGYYLGFFESINETGYFFKCPYSYNDSRWVAGRSILNAIGRDPFLPINCFIAAYENGRRVKLFDEAFHGYSRGPLMSGDSQNHRNLFTFFDVLLSVALIFFLMKFYHLFK